MNVCVRYAYRWFVRFGQSRFTYFLFCRCLSVDKTFLYIKWHNMGSNWFTIISLGHGISLFFIQAYTQILSWYTVIAINFSGIFFNACAFIKKTALVFFFCWSHVCFYATCVLHKHHIRYIENMISLYHASIQFYLAKRESVPFQFAFIYCSFSPKHKANLMG